jgi:hypothetical protein
LLHEWALAQNIVGLKPAVIILHFITVLKGGAIQNTITKFIDGKRTACKIEGLRSLFSIDSTEVLTKE